MKTPVRGRKTSVPAFYVAVTLKVTPVNGIVESLPVRLLGRAALSNANWPPLWKLLMPAVGVFWG